MVSHETAAPSPIAPDMIPSDCEALLNESHVWAYSPGQKWRPSSATQAMEVAKFFGKFRLVPLATSHALRSAEVGGAIPADIQVCDVFLAQTFLEAILEYRWGKAERLEAGRQLHAFLLNQQSLFLPLAHRALALRVYVNAVKRGLVPGSLAKVKGLGEWLQLESEKVKSDTQGLKLSGQVRDRVGALLPLP